MKIKFILFFVLLSSLVFADDGYDDNWAAVALVATSPDKTWVVYNGLEDVDFPLSVRALSLRGKGLNMIPKDIRKFRNLEYLDLSNNDIEKLDVDFLKSFKRLEVLDLERNKISSLDEDFCRLSDNECLTHLNLKKNKISSISADVVHFKSLQFLNLSENPIGKIPKFLGDLPNLKILFANDCGAREWLGGEYGKLMYLGLDYNYLDVSSLRDFPPSILEIGLVGNKIKKFSLEGAPLKLKMVALMGNDVSSVDVAGRKDVVISNDDE